MHFLKMHDPLLNRRAQKDRNMYNMKQIYHASDCKTISLDKLLLLWFHAHSSAFHFFFFGTSLLTNCGEAIREKITDCVDK